MNQSIPLIITIVPNPDNFPYPEIPNMFTGPPNSSTESELSTQSSSAESELSTQSASSTESDETHVSFNTVRYDIDNASDSDIDDNDTIWSLDFNAVDVSEDNNDNDTVSSLDFNAVDVSVDNDTVLSLDCFVVNIGNDDNVRNTVFNFSNHTFNPNLPITTHVTTMTIDNNEMDIKS
tara:strand:+ start:1827 stop:2360 length:534 start_codon:yes stop_codon:yes gene_type:complete